MTGPTFPENDQVLREVIQRLVAVFRPEAIYLFGSRARGEATQDSDYDVMLIVPDDAPPEKRRSRLAYQVLRGTRVAADILVWTKGAFDSRLHLPASLPAAILREGKLLYVAGSGAEG
jgi:predicted nucleotidyltransferase